MIQEIFSTNIEFISVDNLVNKYKAKKKKSDTDKVFQLYFGVVCFNYRLELNKYTNEMQPSLMHNFHLNSPSSFGVPIKILILI